MPSLENGLRRLTARFRNDRPSRSLNTSNGTSNTNGANTSPLSVKGSNGYGKASSSAISMPAPQLDVGHTTPLTIPVPQITVEAAGPEDESSRSDVVKHMAASGLYDKVLAGPETRKKGKLHDILGGVDAVLETAATVAEAAQPAQDFLSSQFMAKMEAKVSSFSEDIPWLMNVLDEITALHPVITVVVLAFKAAYYIEMTRRENDKRIKALYVEMKEMIHVLIHLKDVKDPEAVDPHGRRLSDRLEYLSKKAAYDIKDCANVCDTFNRKGPLIRMLKGAIWEARLVTFIQRFNKRRAQFQEAVAIHTTRVVDSIQVAVGSIEAKLDLITKLFHQYTPPDELILARKVEEKGKDLRSIQNNDKDLHDLLIQEGKLDSTSSTNEVSQAGDKKMGRGPDRGMKRLGLTLKELREELREDLDESIQKNLTTFENKFMLYHRQMHESLMKVLHENHSQLLSAVRGGPHERIKDKELRKIWHDMNWRRNVKARLFVMTLRDNFQDKLAEMKLTTREAHLFKKRLDEMDDKESRMSIISQAMSKDNDHFEEATPPGTVDDIKGDWSYQYISLAWLQPIMEAFDDDCSGYITINEINRFTDAKPQDLNWTLQHWIAYWAVGWQISARHYRNEILDLFADMFHLLPKLRPENRYWADYYLSKVWPYTAELVLALQWDDLPDLQHKFQAYIDLEEARMKKNLEDIKYNVDSRDLAFRVGGERIEKHVLPLIFLLMKRDLEIFRVAQRKVIHQDELWDATENLLSVFDAVVLRVSDLTTLFTQQQADVTAQMNVMASGLLRYYYDHHDIWLMTNLWSPKYDYLEGQHTDLASQSEDVTDSENVLQYPLREPCRADTSVFDTGFEYEEKIPSELDLQAVYPQADLLGRWCGYLYDAVEFPSQVMREFYIHVTSLEEGTFEADGRDFHGVSYHLTGSCHVNDQHQIEVRFSVSYINGNDTEYFQGRIDPSGALVGYMGWSENVMDAWSQEFIFKQLPADTMIYYPSVRDLETNTAQARWSFAIQAILHNVRKKIWSWSYFAKRRTIRKRYIQLNIAYWTYGRKPVNEEYEEFINRYRSLTPSEACYYRSIRDYLLDVLPRHDNITCAKCFASLGGARLICLDCQPADQEFWQTMDFCDHTKCYDITIFPFLQPDKPHRPTHDLMKLRTVLHRRDMPSLDREAKIALTRARLLWTRHPMFSAINRPNHDCISIPSVRQSQNHAGSDRASAQIPAFNKGGDNDRIVSEAAPVAETASEHVMTLAARVPLPSSVASSAQSESSNSHVSSGPSTNASQVHFGPQCEVCRKDLVEPCWYCVSCQQGGLDTFLCDACESENYLPCRNCHKPYVQPRYYYGSEPGDTFICNVCTIKGVVLLDVVKDLEMRHVCTHVLVRVQERIEDPIQPQPPTIDERISSLEEHVDAIDTKLDRLEFRLEELMLSQDRFESRLNDMFDTKFSQMQQMLARLIGPSPTMLEEPLKTEK